MTPTAENVSQRETGKEAKVGHLACIFEKCCRGGVLLDELKWSGVILGCNLLSVDISRAWAHQVEMSACR